MIIYYLPFGLQHNRKPYKQSFTICSEDSLYQIENKGPKPVKEFNPGCIYIDPSIY